MPFPLEYAINAFVTVLAAGLVFAWWVANRKRIAAETVGRAEEQALRVLRDAERDAEAKKKEALLEAKEKAHDLAAGAEHETRARRQEIVTLEQTLADKTRALAERITATDKLDQELRARDRAIGD
ncbi:MAG: Rnase Y domain-containing protein, partial [Vicinamibacterales bacterium]